MRQESAEAIGAQALAWLAGNETLFPVFLNSSGIDIATLRDTAGDPAILGAVLDFVLMDDVWITEFCDVANLAYDQPMLAHQVLAGRSNMHWT